ncbi:unnamed protein product, partial [Rotaria sp. Silwood2]
MYSTPQQSQPTPMNTGQAYVPTSYTTNDQYTLAQNGSYSNDQVLVQHWYNNNGQSIEQTRQVAANQLSVPLGGQQSLHHQQQPLQQQYVTSNQGIQQCMPPLMGQQVTYQQQAPMLSHYIASNNALPSSMLMSQPMVTSTPGPTIVSDQMAQVSKRQIDD